MISAKVIEDSLSPVGVRLTTLELRYPRFIHAEFMTHRKFSRNASSSRAIPVSKMLEQVRRDIAMPTYWGKNQPGMQAFEEVDDQTKEEAKRIWVDAASAALMYAKQMHELGVHKQTVNRILEPFMYISVIVTASSFQNFFDLRLHKDAQPEIKDLAFAMQEALITADPVRRINDNSKVANWHLPYVSQAEREAENDPYQLAKISAARCARVSYLTHDGRTPDISEDLKLYDRLVGSKPIHASPVEHQAYPQATGSRNFDGWYQFREIVEKQLRSGESKWR